MLAQECGNCRLGNVQFVVGLSHPSPILEQTIACVPATYIQAKQTIDSCACSSTPQLFYLLHMESLILGNPGVFFHHLIPRSRKENPWASSLKLVPEVEIQLFADWSTYCMRLTNKHQKFYTKEMQQLCQLILDFQNIIN